VATLPSCGASRLLVPSLAFSLSFDELEWMRCGGGCCVTASYVWLVRLTPRRYVSDEEGSYDVSTVTYKKAPKATNAPTQEDEEDDDEEEEGPGDAKPVKATARKSARSPTENVPS
jgi:hypothetical protein